MVLLDERWPPSASAARVIGWSTSTQHRSVFILIVKLLCLGLIENIKIFSHNKSQQDARFLKFIFVNNSTCFVQTYRPSSGVLVLYSQQLVFVIEVCWLSASEVSSILTLLAYSQHSCMTNTNCCEYSAKIPWWWTVSLSETCRVVYQNKVEN